MGQLNFSMARKLRTLGGDQRLPYLLKAVPLIDLTNLQPSATAGEIGLMCGKASAHGTAAVCVGLGHANRAREALPDNKGPLLAVACGGFPTGRMPLGKKLAEIARAMESGADEIDTVINLDALSAGDVLTVRSELSGIRKEAGVLKLKVIIESGILRPAQIILASRLAIDEGADFLKTSSGFAGRGATPEAVELMMGAIKASGRSVGMKPSGGITDPSDALGYMLLAEEMLGPGALCPSSFRLGASSLLDRLLREIAVHSK